jgi:hypothetical protein
MADLNLTSLSEHQKNEVLAAAAKIKAERAAPKPYDLFPVGTVVSGPFIPLERTVSGRGVITEDGSKYARGVGIVRSPTDKRIHPFKGGHPDRYRYVYIEIVVGDRISGGYFPDNLRAVPALKATD